MLGVRKLSLLVLSVSIVLGVSMPVAQASGEEPLSEEQLQANEKETRKKYPNTKTTTYKPGTREVATLTDQFGTMNENVPCPCVFDKGRYFYKQEINLLGYVWGCKEYHADGVCLDIVRNKPDKK